MYIATIFILPYIHIVQLLINEYLFAERCLFKSDLYCFSQKIESSNNLKGTLFDNFKLFQYFPNDFNTKIMQSINDINTFSYR